MFLICLSASDETGLSLEQSKDDDDEAKHDRELDREILRLEKVLRDFKNTEVYEDDDTVVMTVRRKLSSLKEKRKSGDRKDAN